MGTLSAELRKVYTGKLAMGIDRWDCSTQQCVVCLGQLWPSLWSLRVLGDELVFRVRSRSSSLAVQLAFWQDRIFHARHAKIISFFHQIGGFWCNGLFLFVIYSDWPDTSGFTLQSNFGTRGICGSHEATIYTILYRFNASRPHYSPQYLPCK